MPQAAPYLSGIEVQATLPAFPVSAVVDLTALGKSPTGVQILNGPLGASVMIEGPSHSPGSYVFAASAAGAYRLWVF